MSEWHEPIGKPPWEKIRAQAERIVELERERDEARRLCEQWRDRWYNRSNSSTFELYPTLPWEKGDG
jgi:hypothetical protein